MLKKLLFITLAAAAPAAMAQQAAINALQQAQQVENAAAQPAATAEQTAEQSLLSNQPAANAASELDNAAQKVNQTRQAAQPAANPTVNQAQPQLDMFMGDHN